MSYFGTFFQSSHTQDHPNIQPSIAGRREKKVCSGFGNGSGLGAAPGAAAGVAFGRVEGGMKVSPNGNINIGPGVGAPWFRGGGEMPMPQNGFRGPSYRAPWTWGRVDVTMNHGGGEANCGGKPMATPLSGNINIDPDAGAPFYWGKGEFMVPPNANVNIGCGTGGVNNGKMSASINYHHGTINF